MSSYIETFRGVVYPWHCDHQGHMNTMHYVGMFDQAFWHHMSALGFTRDYMDRKHGGFVDVRDTIEYKSEDCVCSLVVFDSWIIKIGYTSLKAFLRMRFIETEELAATSEKISVYFDLEARSKAPFPDDLRPNMEANIVEPNA
jgi:acyl-CoA thioester hydrolase